MINKKYNIDVIKGDTCEKNVVISGVDNSLITNVYFTCKDLNIEKSLTYDSNVDKWLLRLESSETKNLHDMTTDFDITVKFDDDDISTILYRGTIRILPKKMK